MRSSVIVSALVAVLRSAGYRVPARSILTVTGRVSLFTSVFGAHTSNLAAITASICTGPDAHSDKDKRWFCGPFYAAGYAILAIFGASVVTLFASFPAALVATFAATASGLTLFGLGAAFWGLVAGLAIHGLDQFLTRGTN